MLDLIESIGKNGHTAAPPSTDINSRLLTSVAIWTSPILDHGRCGTEADVRRRL
jgi:hypothetical protein